MFEGDVSAIYHYSLLLSNLYGKSRQCGEIGMHHINLMKPETRDCLDTLMIFARLS